ncbi:MAG: PIG-L deacetylase family protein [Mariprofundaceae bacterium]|nr:PIG-L deacetylase family protein [Mariprofundaceae bacterium]
MTDKQNEGTSQCLPKRTPEHSPQRILALAPHPDDLEIGCGGTLAEHAARGDEVHIFIATFGDVGGAADIRKAEQQLAADILGVHCIHWGEFRDTMLPNQQQDLMIKLESIIQQVKPDIVYVNHSEDTHQDHRILAKVAHSVTRYVPNVLAYETPSTTTFEPTAFMGINNVLQLKLKALSAHASQLERTHIRLNIIEIALATVHFRGMQSKLSCAEAFMPIRMLL